MDYDIFISYCYIDNNIAKQLCDALSRKGLSAFFDTNDIKSGSDYASTFVKSIQGAKYFICLYGKNSNNSQWQKHEIEFANEEFRNRKENFIISILVSPEVKKELYNHPILRNYTILEYSSDIDEIANKIARSFFSPKKSVTSTSDATCETYTQTPNRTQNTQKQDNAPHKTKNKFGCSHIFSIISLIILICVLYLMYNIGLFSPGSSSKYSTDSIQYDNFVEDWLKIDTIAADTTFTDTIAADTIAFDIFYYPLETDIEDVKIDTNNMSNIDKEENIDSSIILAPSDTLNFRGCNDNNPIQEPTETAESNDSGLSKYIIGAFCGIILCLSVIITYNKVRKKKKTIKFSSDRNCNLNIDGKKHSELVASEIEKVQLYQGRYIIDFIADEQTSKRFIPTISNNGGDDAIFCKFNDEKNSSRKVINCIIEGSTSLDRERDALRATMSIMYNQWKDYNFSILSYTYEDFPMEVTENGQQSLYDKFITTDADLAVFIFDKTIGPISRSEFNKAYDSFRTFGHPKILIYSKIHNTYSSEMTDLKKLVDEINQYWIPYKDIEHLKLSFKDYFTWILMRLYRKELTK